jgi:hypothetical protein
VQAVPIAELLAKHIGILNPLIAQLQAVLQHRACPPQQCFRLCAGFRPQVRECLVVSLELLANLRQRLYRLPVWLSSRQPQRQVDLCLHAGEHAAGRNLPGVQHGLHFRGSPVGIFQCQLQPGLGLLGQAGSHILTPGFNRIQGLVWQAVLRRRDRCASAAQNQGNNYQDRAKCAKHRGSPLPVCSKNGCE